MKKFKKKIERNDMFGHQIGLTFNKKGSSHNTLIGGITSIIVKIFLAIYIYTIFSRMINREDDIISKEKEEVEYEELGDVKYNETDVVSFYKLIK